LISKILQIEIENNLKEIFEKAKIILNKNGYDINHMKLPKLHFNLKGKVSGKALSHSFNKEKDNIIKLNYQFLNNPLYELDMKTETLYHEFTHLIVAYLKRTLQVNKFDTYYGKVNPHGKQWKYIMKLMNFELSVTHNYIIENKNKYNRITYICNCREHEETKYIHNKILKGAKYQCKHCKGFLRLKHGAKFKKIEL